MAEIDQMNLPTEPLMLCRKADMAKFDFAGGQLKVIEEGDEFYYVKIPLADFFILSGTAAQVDRSFASVEA